jgi:hypothetical protein
MDQQTTVALGALLILAAVSVLSRVGWRLLRTAGWILRTFGWVAAIAAAARFSAGMVTDGLVLAIASAATFAAGEVLHHLATGYWHSRLLQATAGRSYEIEEVDDDGYLPAGLEGGFDQEPGGPGDEWWSVAGPVDEAPAPPRCTRRPASHEMRSATRPTTIPWVP